MLWQMWNTKLPKHRSLVPLETSQGVWDIHVVPMDLAEDLEETFTRVAAEGQAEGQEGHIP